MFMGPEPILQNKQRIVDLKLRGKKSISDKCWLCNEVACGKFHRFDHANILHSNIGNLTSVIV